jgi:hypothetical protein
MILGDRVQLQQVSINLVMNGIEAMQSVTDRTRELVIRSRQDETQVLVDVTDSGVGISGENADRLFNPFFTTKASGMGMGLSICRSIMEAHGGRLWATADLTHGATFHFTQRRHGSRRPVGSRHLGWSEPVHGVMFLKHCKHCITVRCVAGFEHYLQARGLNAWRREQAMVGHFDDVGSGLSDAG